MIDNYDSFTYNLVHLVRELGAEVTVFRNDQFELSALDSYDKIMLSPGPGMMSFVPTPVSSLFSVYVLANRPSERSLEADLSI